MDDFWSRRFPPSFPFLEFWLVGPSLSFPREGIPFLSPVSCKASFPWGLRNFLISASIALFLIASSLISCPSHAIAVIRFLFNFLSFLLINYSVAICLCHCILFHVHCSCLPRYLRYIFHLFPNTNVIVLKIPSKIRQRLSLSRFFFPLRQGDCSIKEKKVFFSTKENT